MHSAKRNNNGKKYHRYCKNIEHLLFINLRSWIAVSFNYSLRRFVDLAHFQEKKETKKSKLFFTEVRDLTTIFLHLFCTFELFCWPCREAFTEPTANKIEAPSTRIRIFFTPDSCGRVLNGLLLKAVLNRSGFGERIHCINTGNPGSVIVAQYGSSKITVFVLGKNTIQKCLGNTK